MSFVSQIKLRNLASFTNWIGSLSKFKTGSMHFLSGQNAWLRSYFGKREKGNNIMY